MPTMDLTEKNFIPTVSGEGIVIVDCWADWCGACKAFTPVYERVAEKFPDHTFGKINTQVEKELISKLGIENIPSLLLYRDSILLFRQPGYYKEKELENIVRQAESLNMEEVKAHIVREEQKKLASDAAAAGA